MSYKDDPVIEQIEDTQHKNMIWRTYDAGHGLPAGVWALMQDHSGYLWLGTRVGFCRYDGSSFTLMDTDASYDVVAIFEDQQGMIWLGTWEGLFCFDADDLRKYTTEDGLPSDKIRCIHEDSEGRLWIGTAGGISCFCGERFSNYTTEDGLSDNYVNDICEDHQGQLWIGTGNGLSCFDGERFTNYATEDGLVSDDIISIHCDSQGCLWIGTLDGASYLDGERFASVERFSGKWITSIYEDREGHLWFATFSGVSIFDGNHWTDYTSEDGLLDNRVNDIIQDRDGRFWFAHHFSGLTCLELDASRILTSEPVTETIIQDSQGRLWFGNENVLCCLVDGQKRRRTYNARVYSLLEDSTGAFWVGTLGDGLYRHDSTDSFWESEAEHFTEKDGLESNEVQFLLETKDGTVWASTGGAGYLCCFDGTRFEAIPAPHGPSFRLFEDNQGYIWMGGWQAKGLACYNGREFVVYTEKDGLLNDRVKSIVEDNAGHLWLGTHRGLCWFDGKRFVTYGRNKAIMALIHQCSAKDAVGRLWFGTLSGGIYYTDGEHFQWITDDDGLPSNSITGLIPQPDGSIIIGTYRGIFHYRPTHANPPGIEIREALADRVYQHSDEIEIDDTQAGILIISYHGLSFATHRMRYSYIMEGYDTEWQDTWDEQVRYENLPIGKYTFKVIAISRDLVCSKTPATLKLTIIPDRWSQLRVEYEAEISRMRKLLQIKRQVGLQETLSDTASAIVDGLRKLGFDRVGVWFQDTTDEALHGLWGTDINGGIYYSGDESWAAENIPSNEGYYVEMSRAILKARLGIDKSSVFLLKGRDEEAFRSIWGYLPPFPGYYNRSEQGDNICLCAAMQEERTVIIAVDNYITGRLIDETQANLLGLVGTEMAKALTNVALRESLTQSEAKSKAILDAIPDVMLRISGDGVFLSHKPVNRSEMYTPGESIIGKHITDFVSLEAAEPVVDCIRKALDSGSIQILEYQLSTPSKLIDYEIRIVVCGKDEVLAIVRDITERKKMEAELLKTQKLESVGLLAGGIAHDLNNFLTGILGNISLARLYPDPAKRDEMLVRAEEASMQVRDLTQQLLTFSKGGAPIKELATISELLKDSAKFVLSGANIRCEFSIPDDLWPAEFDAGQMNQVISNLVINANEAMPDGGVLRISVENTDVDVEHGLPLEPGPYIKMSIQDQGTGISEEILLRIFDPFFTTKHKGNGLGLATSYSIISNHNGYITAESRIGVGTTFHIYLPASPMEVLITAQEAEDGIAPGAGKILVIDDEEMVRELTTSMLTHAGYEVVTTMDGSQALEVYRDAMQSGDPFDAVVMDLTIPGGMGGKEAIKKFIELDPHVKAIVSSGYSNDPVMSNFREYGFKGVIAKPYRPKELCAVLNQVIKE